MLRILRILHCNYKQNTIKDEYVDITISIIPCTYTYTHQYHHQTINTLVNPWQKLIFNSLKQKQIKKMMYTYF